MADDSHEKRFDTIIFTVCFAGGEIGNASLQPLYERFQAVLLPSLPKVKVQAKKRRLEITYATRVADATFLEKFGPVSGSMFRAVVEEMAEAVGILAGRMKKSDELDVVRLQEDMRKLAAAAPGTDEEAAALEIDLNREAAAREALKDPWEKLGIEWDDYHPSARNILNRPFFWSQIDDYSPHGNDTGADILAEFFKWNKKNRDKPAFELANRVLKAWELSDDVTVADDAMIAVAFAAIKIRGSCDLETRERAMAAIARQESEPVLQDRGWSAPQERVATLGVLRRALGRAS